MNLELDVNFETKTLSGSVKLSVEKIVSSAAVLVRLVQHLIHCAVYIMIL